MGMTSEELNKFAEDSKKFHDQWVAIEFQFKLAGAALTEGLMPSLQDVVKQIRSVDWVAFGQSIGIIAEGFVKFATAAGTLAGYLQKIAGFMGMAGFTQVGAMIGNNAVTGSGMGAQNPNSTPGLLAGAVGPTQTPPPVTPQNNLGGGGGGSGNIFDAIKESLEKFSTLFSDKILKMQKDSKGLNDYWGTMAKDMGDAMIGSINKFNDAFSTGITNMIFNGGKFKDVMMKCFQDMAEYFIQQVIKMIAQWLEFLALKAILSFLDIGGALLPGLSSGGVFARAGVVMARNGVVSAASGLNYNGYQTGSFGEAGIPAVLHPGELVTPISKFYDFVKQVSGNSTININGGNQDPRILAELVALEVDRKRRNP
jgi:hypothetical protein